MKRPPGKASRGLVAAAAAIAVTLAVTPSSAYADPVLTPNRPLEVRSVATANWAFNTTGTYWSALAVQPTPGRDFDLSVSNETGVLKESRYRAAGRTEWVAINSNVRPVWSYQAQISRFGASRPGVQYRIQLAQTNQVLRPEPAEQHLALGDPSSRFPGFVAVRDIWLDENRIMSVRIKDACEAGEGNLVQAYVLSPTTSMANAGDALAGVGDDSCPSQAHLVYHSTQTGWHGLVIVVNNQRTPRPREVEVVYGVAYP